jgi:hypothetical protein
MTVNDRPAGERDIPPADLRLLARARSQARREHRFDEADRIRAEIEAHGWNVVDRGTEARLVRAHPLDVVGPDGLTRYGWSGAVPDAGAAQEAGAAPDATDAVTVVFRALPKAEATDSLVARLTGGGASPRHVLVVAGDEHPDPTLPGIELIRLRGEVGPGSLLAVALRRVADGVVVVGERWPADANPDDIDALAGRLQDEAVAVTGLVGARSDDLRRFAPGGVADTPVEAVGWAGLAFRARDGRARVPIDEGFSDAELLAAWWSLTLRDGEDDDDDSPPRRAVAVRTAETAPSAELGPRDDQTTRRDRYRLIDRFAGRDDLLVREASVR